LQEWPLLVACMGLQISRHEHEYSSRLPMLRGLRVPGDGGASRSPLAPGVTLNPK
jgi:hypothetical protein